MIITSLVNIYHHAVTKSEIYIVFVNYRISFPNYLIRKSKSYIYIYIYIYIKKHRSRVHDETFSFKIFTISILIH